MKNAFLKSSVKAALLLLLLVLSGCSQFETPLEIPESGSIQVLTTSDAKCTLYLSDKPVMEWTGSKILPGLMSGNYIVKITSDKFNSTFEEAIKLGTAEHKKLESGIGSLDIKIKSDFSWELSKDGKALFTGKGSYKIDTLWSGNYKVKVTIPGATNTYSKDLSIIKSQINTLEMEYGTVDVRVPNTMEVTLLNGTTETTRWYGTKTIDSLWVGDYTVKIKVNPLLPDYETSFSLAKHQTKIIEPLLGSFVIKTKSDYQNTLLLEGVEIVSWTGTKEFNPFVAGNYILRSKMFPSSSAVEQSFILQQNENKIIEWEYGKITVNTLPASSCKLNRVGNEILSWQGSRILDSIITGNYTLEIQEAVSHPVWIEKLYPSKDEQKSIALPYALVQITTNISSSKTKLMYNGIEIKSVLGNGEIRNIVPGVYTLMSEAEGYIAQSESLTLSSGQILSRNIILKPHFTSMVTIPSGTFIMGCTSQQSECSSNETPTHQVTLSAYEIGKYEITQKEWRTIMGTSPSYFTGDNRPVEQVSWYDILTFCNTLSTREGLTPVYIDTVTANWTANGYRLPTEAEWEYAARGGASSTNTLYSGSNNVAEVAWYSTISGDKSHDVGTKSPNELGIYDMSGNVYEWCWDRYGDYSSSSQINPKGAPEEYLYRRVHRGGCWISLPEECRVYRRALDFPSIKGSRIGFRLARTL